MTTKKQATYQSGKNKGKLKPGYRYGKGGHIIASRNKRKTVTKRKRQTKKLFKLF